MAKKKSIAKKSVPADSTLLRIAGKVGELAGKAMNQKDQLVALATDAIDNMRSKISSPNNSKKAARVTPTQPSKTKAPKKVASKNSAAAGSSAKKTPVKAVKKSRPVSKKASTVSASKTATSKSGSKKLLKKAVSKKGKPRN